MIGTWLFEKEEKIDQRTTQDKNLVNRTRFPNIHAFDLCKILWTIGRW